MRTILEYLNNWETVICVVYGDPRHTPASVCCISPCNHFHRYNTAIRRDQIYLTVHKLAFTYVLSMVSRGVCLQVFVVYLFATMSTVITCYNTASQTAQIYHSSQALTRTRVVHGDPRRTPASLCCYREPKMCYISHVRCMHFITCEFSQFA